MRWKGIITLIVLLAAVIVISLFFIDNWLESGIENAGSSIVGARVDIDGLDFDLTGLSIKWDRLQVTDPNSTMQNIVETGRVAFNMNAAALLRKRYIIDEITFADVRSGTPRERDGAIPQKPKKKNTEPTMIDKIQVKLEDEIDKLPVMNFDFKTLQRSLNVDSLIEISGITIIDKFDSAKTDLETTSDRWQKFYGTFKPDEELKNIRSDFTNIKPKEIKSVPVLLNALETIKTSYTTLNSLHDTITVKHQEIHQDFARLQSYRGQVSSWIDEDYHQILEKAQLPDLNVANIAKILFGGTIVKNVNQYLNYAFKVRELMPKKSDKPNKKKDVRMRGQDILYADRLGWPTFLIRKALVSGEADLGEKFEAVNLSGEITGVTSQPAVYGKPTFVNLKGLQENKLSGLISAVFDHTTERAKDSLNLKILNKSLNGYTIYRSPYLPSQVSKGMADIDYVMRLRENDFLVQIDMLARDLEFDFTQMDDRSQFVTLVQEVIESVDLITLNTRIFSNGDNIQFAVSSNIDRLVSRKLKSMGSQALVDAENKIRGKLDKIKSEKLAELNTLLAANRPLMLNKIDASKSLADEKQQLLESKLKEVQDDIERRKKEQEDKLLKKAEDALKDIFKKKE